MFGLNRKASIGLATAVVALVTATAGVGMVQAQSDSTVRASGSATSVSTTDLRYSDAEVTEFLASGYGRAADDHPELASKFRTQSTPPPASDVAALLSLLQSVDPSFHSRVTVAVQSGTPTAAQSGIAAFSEDLKKVTTKQSDKAGVRPNGFFLQGEVAQSVLVATTVAVGAEAFAVIVLLYNFNDDSAHAFDKSALAAAVANGLK